MVTTAIAAPSPALAYQSLSDDQAIAARKFAQKLSEDEIVEASDRHAAFVPRFGYPEDKPVVFIKFGDQQLLAEADSQRQACEWTNSVRQSAPDSFAGRIFVPEVYKTFTKEHSPDIPYSGTAYIVMQYVHGTDLNRMRRDMGQTSLQPSIWMEPCFELVSQGIQLLRRMPVLDDAWPGPYTKHTSRRINHQLFKDQQAATDYANIQELEDHLNRMLLKGHGHWETPPKIELEKHLKFCYTDFNEESFHCTTDPDGCLRMYVIDYEHASFLPPTFLGLAVFQKHTRWFLSHVVARKMGDTIPKPDFELFDVIQYYFAISGVRAGLLKSRSRGNDR